MLLDSFGQFMSSGLNIDAYLVSEKYEFIKPWSPPSYDGKIEYFLLMSSNTWTTSPTNVELQRSQLLGASVVIAENSFLILANIDILSFLRERWERRIMPQLKHNKRAVLRNLFAAFFSKSGLHKNYDATIQPHMCNQLFIAFYYDCTHIPRDNLYYILITHKLFCVMTSENIVFTLIFSSLLLALCAYGNFFFVFRNAPGCAHQNHPQKFWLMASFCLWIRFYECQKTEAGRKMKDERSFLVFKIPSSGRIK